MRIPAVLSAATAAAVHLNHTLYSPVLGSPRVAATVSGSGPAVLLLNGFGAAGTVWPHQVIELAGHTVLRVDARGTGRSRDLSTAYTIATLADDARSAMLDHGISSAVVVGWSLGGMVAQELALRYPEGVSKLILVGSVPPVPEMRLPMTRTPVLMARLAIPSTSARWQRGVWALGGPGAAHEHPEAMREFAVQLAAAGLSWWGPMLQSAAATTWRDPGRLSRITAPTTILHGTDDPVVPVSNARTLARLIPGARLTALPGVGHLVPYEATSSLIEEITHDR
ncbi:alpha/beta hydrolase [Gordonia sp. TBRC 11910]|uniref:Alpha/beta hydrolase n=1 Tax=Gordonia asplenii TaxID=2725283 RepID=A0A848KZK9_9ACTN|nr:alpha/beta hydrolase [Gordonia asplenii]NMO01631.1 alpha/beta hydrolase [Gordonia asplenii]